MRRATTLKTTSQTTYLGPSKAPFSCIHCKSIDHPRGLCPYAQGANSDDGGLDDLHSDDAPGSRVMTR